MIPITHSDVEFLRLQGETGSIAFRERDEYFREHFGNVAETKLSLATVRSVEKILNIPFPVFRLIDLRLLSLSRKEDDKKDDLFSFPSARIGPKW